MKLWSENFNALSLDIDREGHSEYWLRGGRGSGKSTFIARKIMLGLLQHPEASALIYRRVANTLRQSVYEEFVKAADALRLRPYLRFRLAPLEVTVKPTGQKILFRGADDPGKSKSITLSRGYFGYLWFEEAAEFAGMDDIRTIRASAFRGQLGQRPITFMSYNPPKSVHNWVNAEALKAVEGRYIHTSDYRGLPAEWIGGDFIREAEALRSTNERAWRHMYLGEVTGTGGQVFDNVALRAITDQELQDIGTFYNGLDFGFAVDPDALVRWGYMPRTRKLLAVSEHFAAQTSVERLAQIVKGVCGSEVVRCDAADPRMISELQQRGVKAVGVKKGPGSVDHGMRWLQELSGIVIDARRTPNIAREFSGYEYQSDKNGNFIPEYPDRDNHTIDATRYALEPEIGKRKIGTIDKRLFGI